MSTEQDHVMHENSLKKFLKQKLSRSDATNAEK